MLFLGIKLIGEIWMLGIGGCRKGLVMCFLFIFLEIFVCKIFGYWLVDIKLWEKIGSLGFVYNNLNFFLKLVFKVCVVCLFG